MYAIHLAKEPFKFSCSHFTVMSAEEAERLHGHNYQVRITLDVARVDPKLGLAFDFNVVKPMIKSLCDRCDERVLIAGDSPYLKVERRGPQTEVSFCERFYSLPTTDVLVLPVVNVTTEELARYFACEMRRLLDDVPDWTRFEVNVEETRGQSVSFSHPR